MTNKKWKEDMFKISNYGIDFCSNGFKHKNTNSDLNQNAVNYVYMAFAEEPVVSSNNIPATAR